MKHNPKNKCIFVYFSAAIQCVIQERRWFLFIPYWKDVYKSSYLNAIVIESMNYRQRSEVMKATFKEYLKWKEENDLFLSKKI